MNEAEALARMIAPGTPRPNKYRQGVVQVWVTRACDKACFGCTQGSNLAGKPGVITLDQFQQAVLSLMPQTGERYFGVVGVFGGNPAMHPQFAELCYIVRKHVPWEQAGIWCNNPMTVENARRMAQTFNPAVSNLNVHLDQKAFNLFKDGWPSCNPVGLHQDSRHSPPFVAMKDIIEDEGKRWELISDCDINKHWSAMIGVFRGQLRAWFCEVAGAQAMLHQDDPDYPDTGIAPTGTYVKDDSAHSGWLHYLEEIPGIKPVEGAVRWWQLPMRSFAHQVRKHCHECGIPLRGHGELAQARDTDLADMDGGIIQDSGREQTSATHQGIYKPKRTGRRVELVTVPAQLGDPLGNVVRYLQNADK